MLRRLVVLMTVLAAGLFVTTLSAEPAAAHSCSGGSEITVVDPTPDDLDDDCVTDSRDNCPGVPNADQIDSDGDGRGDRCDDDDDNDGLLDPDDNCRTVPNVDQKRTMHAFYGDACLFDRDGDGAIDADDNCRSRLNPDQADNDRDGAGDVCDADDDNDGVLDERDNCPLNSNKSQADADGDGIGDACDRDAYTGPGFLAPSPANQTAPGGDRAAGSGRAADRAAAADRTAARVTLKVAGTQRATDARGGMPVRVTCSEACAVSAQIMLGKSVARKLKLKTVVAKGDAALEGAGSTYVFLDFSRSAFKKLFRGSARVKVTLKLKVLDGAGNAASVSRPLRLAK